MLKVRGSKKGTHRPSMRKTGHSFRRGPTDIGLGSSVDMDSPDAESDLSSPDSVSTISKLPRSARPEPTEGPSAGPARELHSVAPEHHDASLQTLHAVLEYRHAVAVRSCPQPASYHEEDRVWYLPPTRLPEPGTAPDVPEPPELPPQCVESELRLPAIQQKSLAARIAPLTALVPRRRTRHELSMQRSASLSGAGQLHANLAQARADFRDGQQRVAELERQLRMVRRPEQRSELKDSKMRRCTSQPLPPIASPAPPERSSGRLAAGEAEHAGEGHAIVSEKPNDDARWDLLREGKSRRLHHLAALGDAMWGAYNGMRADGAPTRVSRK